MLRTIKFLILILALAGCAAMPWIDERQDGLRQEAEYLAGLVKKNKITKVQAADRLNIKRIVLVGANPYDDEVFAYYHHLTEERDSKKISATESQSLMKKKLEEIRARYREHPAKPSLTPVFTNYMMSLYGLPAL